MAKSGGKSTKKSGNSGKTGKSKSSKKGAGSNKKSTPKKKGTKKKDETEEKKPVNRAEYVCEYCQKPMKTKKTLLIHQRNCKEKQEKDNKKEIEAELLKIKDQFEDERQNLEDDFRKREETLQDELDQMRTVLRMEIDKHRKELEMIRKVEKEVAHVSENSAVPREGKKAIDMIPTPLPKIPKKEIPEEPEPAPEPAPRQEPVIPTPMPREVPEAAPEPKAQEAAKSTEQESVKEDSKPVQPVLARPQQPSISKEEIEEMIKASIPEKISENKSAVSSEELAEINSKLKSVMQRMEAMDSRISRMGKENHDQLERFERESNVKRLQKELDKISDKVQDMMEDTGFGEELSVSKIPPTILEIVYQATLDDIHLEIVRTKGSQDAEKIARSALEEVRLKTSGSELFKFDGRKIVTDNLAKSIEANLISAKQIQTTYDVLLDRLLETVPHHKAKNFKGMIKVKSQEFAVDRATVLTKSYNRLEKVVESTSQMVAAISAQFNSRTLEINQGLDEIKNTLMEAKASKEDISNLMEKLKERDEAHARLSDEVNLLKAEVEMKKEIEAKEEKDESFIVPGETNEDIPEESAAPDEQEPEEEKTDVLPVILDAVQKGASSKTAIIRETGIDEDTVLENIAILVKDNKVIEKKAGKRIKYLTPEVEMEEKLKAQGKKEPAKKKSKSKKPSKKDESDKETKKKTEKKENKKKKDSGKKAKKETEKPDKKPKPEKKPVKQVTDDKEGKKTSKQPGEKPEPKDKPEAQKPEEKKNKAKEETKAEPEEKHVDDELPVITKSLEELSDDEKHVLDSMGKDGMSISGIQSKVGKDMKRFALLRALRVLIDSGYVEIITKGRMDLYKKINVKKIDKKEKEKDSKEVK